MAAEARSARQWFKRVKIIEILAAAFIPFLSGLSFAGIKAYLSLTTGGLGVLIKVLEGILHLNQYQETGPIGGDFDFSNRIAVCDGCSSLRHRSACSFHEAKPNWRLE